MSFIIGTIFCLSLSLFYLSCEAYDPVDVCSISCGFFSNSTDEENQTWTGDISSKLLLSTASQQEKPSFAAQVLTQSSSTNSVPYTTARLSYSNFTYSFPVTAGQKFIRLYFYPTSYEQGFDRYKAFFSVTSGAFTLLKDFNASLTADADNDSLDTIFREYSINVGEGQRLNLTFSPSTIQSDLYAFINGIQILSMPTNLYYTDSERPGFQLVGWDNIYFNIANNSALQTEYRLNVGGKDISPRDDTGLLRSWENDEKYVTTPSALPTDYSTGIKLSFTLVPNYTAPDPVYRSARSMGTNGTLNKMSNLSWEFPVNSGFTYMLRLHFCELNPDIKLPSDRVFYIFIDDKLAEDHADVLQWSQRQKGVPVYRDYVVLTFGNGKKYNLTLKLHPNPPIRKTAYFDAFLNGLEIFRISDPQSNNLAGPNPDPLTPAPPEYQQLTQNQKKSSRPSIICVVAGVVAGFALLLLLVAFFIVRRGRQFNHANSDDRTSRWTPFSSTTTKSRSSSLPSDLCRYFSIAEIKAATNNFDELFKVGVGGFGNVYKGYIDDNTTVVAIKRLKPGSQQGAQEFMNEIGMLSQLRHLHLVSLIGYCNENNEMILVYDYMARGTLRDHLYNTDNPPLSWKQRIQICIGAARGLHYLHTGAKQMIIHRDVKSTNILLDEQWVAKVSDFGLSKIGPSGISRSHITTVIKGSFGYLDPDYNTRQRLTIKSDVYAFGVVLLEVLCGRPPLLRTIDKSKICLSDCARKCYHEGIIDQMVDPFLKGRIAPECLKTISDVAMNCLLDDGSQRPSMNDVVWGLEFALQLQENAEQRDQICSKVEVMERGEIGNEDSDDMFSSSSGRMVSDFNKNSGISMTSSASEEQSAGNKDTDKLMPDSAFEIMDQIAS